MKTCRVTIADTDGVLLDRAEVALGSLQRLRGLMGRRALPPGEGLLIPHCSSVHTFFMRFPIDVVYLWRDNRVLKIVHAMRCCRVSACWSARSVLEMPAGWAEAHDLRAGRTLTFHDIAP